MYSYDGVNLTYTQTYTHTHCLLLAYKDTLALTLGLTSSLLPAYTNSLLHPPPPPPLSPPYPSSLSPLVYTLHAVLHTGTCTCKTISWTTVATPYIYILIFHKPSHKSHEWVLVFLLGPDCDTPYWTLSAGSEFCCTKSVISTRARLRGLLVRFSTQLSWPPNCTLWMSLSTWHVYWLTPSKKCQELLCIYHHWVARIELISFIGVPAKAIRIESAEMHYKLMFVNHNPQAIYPILVKGWQTIRDAREDIWYCLKVNRF